MGLNFRFAVVSDPHVALPHTIWDSPKRFHLAEISIPAIEKVFNTLAQLELDFLLLPGDLTQHGEPENHAWLANRLAQLPFPVYVVPGNHDVPVAMANHQSIGLADFPQYYCQLGFENTNQLYYTCEVLPGVRLIGLNSNQFDADGRQLGRMDEQQLVWLEDVLAKASTRDELVLVMIHHNVLEHLPNQSRHPMGRRYMLDNAPVLLQMLRKAGVQLVFTGHLHVQDIACSQGVYDITTGSLVSYPHPYRILNFRTETSEESVSGDRQWLEISSPRVESLPGWPTLPQHSREWMGDRSHFFMIRLLCEPPLSLPGDLAEQLAPKLRYFWADLAQGDAMFDFAEFPVPVRRFFERFNATNAHGEHAAIDNHTTLVLENFRF